MPCVNVSDDCVAVPPTRGVDFHVTRIGEIAPNSLEIKQSRDHVI